jgi:hypothetical protein
MLTGVWLSAVCLALALSVLLVWPRFAAAETLLRVGLLVLMTTPAMRVALSVVEALRQRDWFWLWTTVAVTMILVGTMSYSLRAGHRRSAGQEKYTGDQEIKQVRDRLSPRTVVVRCELGRHRVAPDLQIYYP